MITTPPFSHHLKALGVKFKSASNRAALCINFSDNKNYLTIFTCVNIVRRSCSNYSDDVKFHFNVLVGITKRTKKVMKKRRATPD